MTLQFGKQAQTPALRQAWAEPAAGWTLNARGATLSSDDFQAKTRFLPTMNGAPVYVVMEARHWEGLKMDGTRTTHAVSDIHVLDRAHADGLLAQGRITNDQVFDRLGQATEHAKAANAQSFESCARDYAAGRHASITAWSSVADAGAPAINAAPVARRAHAF